MPEPVDTGSRRINRNRGLIREKIVRDMWRDGWQSHESELAGSLNTIPTELVLDTNRDLREL